MRFTTPKLLPTLVCLAVVGLVAAILPYPGLDSPITPLDAEADPAQLDSKNSGSSQSPKLIYPQQEAAVQTQDSSPLALP
jgi:hypothetical protein